jgi:hypothetical protein
MPNSVEIEGKTILLTPTGEPNEVLISAKTPTHTWKLFTIAPEYGLKRYRGIEDPLIDTDEFGRIVIRR